MPSPLELLKICDLVKQWPTLQAIHDITMAELVDMNEDAKGELAKRAEAKAKAKAEADAKAAADAKVIADKAAAQAKVQADAQAKAQAAAATPTSVGA